MEERLPEDEARQYIEDDLDGIGYLYPCLLTYKSPNTERIHVVRFYYDIIQKWFVNNGEELCEKGRCIAWMPLPAPYDLDRLRELVQADREGRCIFLPCKVGDTIYKIGYTTCKNGETHPDSYGCCGCLDECDMALCVKNFVVPSLSWALSHYNEFSEGIWYFTSEAAEAALKETEG